jgi:pimeloyl-ACP methyl ester carboxylesterase
MPIPFRFVSRLAGFGAALSMMTSAMAAQGGDMLVDKSLKTPEVSALQAPAQRIGEFAEVNGARIFYEARGNGPAMLLLHGYPLSGALFARVREALQSDYKVITLDHRGYGKSEAPGTPDSVDVYAKDALAVMDKLGIDKAIIGGMSMGGPIALSMYRQAPQRFSGLILIDTIAAAASPAEAGLWNGVADMIRAGNMEAVIKTLMPDMLTGQTRMAQKPVVDYLETVMKQASREGAIGGAIALAKRPDASSMLGQIKVPTLIMVGLTDAVYSFEISRRMHEAIPNSKLAIIPGASHAAVFEAPGHAAAAISDWGKSLQK